MIDWDEIDWKRGIATMVLGLVLIAVGFFLLNDYYTSRRVKADLDQNLSDINAYAAKYPPPAVKDSSQVEAQVQDLEAQVAASKVKLPESYDDAAVQAEIQSRADLQGAKLLSVEPQPAVTRGFLVYHPVQVTFSGARDQITGFLHSLDFIPYLHEMETKPVSFTDKLTVTVNVLSFDKDSWLGANPCQELIPLPALRETKVMAVQVFKDQLAGEQQAIENKVGELQKAQSLAKKTCELNHAVGIAQFKLQALKSPRP